MAEATETGAARRALNGVRGIDRTTSAVVLIVMAVIMVQVGAAFGKSLFAGLGPWGATFVRLASAAIIMLVVYRPRLAAGRARTCWRPSGSACRSR